MTVTRAQRIQTLGILLGAAYFPVIAWMLERWRAPDAYYSHGFLIPCISAFIVWRKRYRLRKLILKPDERGWLFLAAGLAVYCISASAKIYFTSAFSLIAAITGIILLFLGREFFILLMFPVTFLVFMVPLPLVAVSYLSFNLKIMATQIAAAFLHELGIHALLEGSVIKTAHTYLIVEDPCSGLRSLVALVAMGALTAHFSKLSRVGKIIVFVSSIPIAVVSNALRITTLALLSEAYGAAVLTGAVHFIMAVVVFIIALVGLTTVIKLLE